MGRRRGLRTLTLAVVLGLVAAGTVAVATSRIVVAQSIVVDTGTTLYDTAKSPYTFANRSYQMLPLNTKIALHFYDDDPLPHTFTIINRSDVAIPNYATISGHALGVILQTYGTLVNITANGTSMGPIRDISQVAAPGWYEFVCIEAGHLNQGMYGYVAFGEALPANLSFATGLPGPGLAVFIIVGTIVALTVLAIVLGFAVGQRRGAVHEMPPERLGYPEPEAPSAAAAVPRPPSGH